MAKWTKHKANLRKHSLKMERSKKPNIQLNSASFLSPKKKTSLKILTYEQLRIYYRQTRTLSRRFTTKNKVLAEQTQYFANINLKTLKEADDYTYFCVVI